MMSSACSRVVRCEELGGVVDGLAVDGIGERRAGRRGDAGQGQTKGGKDREDGHDRPATDGALHVPQHTGASAETGHRPTPPTERQDPVNGE